MFPYIYIPNIYRNFTGIYLNFGDKFHRMKNIHPFIISIQNSGRTREKKTLKSGFLKEMWLLFRFFTRKKTHCTFQNIARHFGPRNEDSSFWGGKGVCLSLYMYLYYVHLNQKVISLRDVMVVFPSLGN